MSQSKGPDQGHGSAAPPRSRLEAFDPREQRAQVPAHQNGYAPQPYAPASQPYVPQPYAPQSEPPQGGPQAPYGGASTAGGYSYPQAHAPLPPQPAPRPQAQPPQQSPQHGQPAPHSAYQYLPQGYSHPAHAQPQPPARQESRFDPQPEPRAQVRQVQPLSQLPGYTRPAQPSQPPAPPAFDPRYLEQALAQPATRTVPPAHAASAPAQPAPALRGGHFDHHAADDPRGYGLPSQIPTRTAPPLRTEYQNQPPPEAQSWDQRDDLPPHPDALEDDEEIEEAPRRGGRRILMVGLLLGAIATGGGLAYAYKTYFSPTRGTVPKVVKAPGEPTRVAPTDPGGKKVANGDIKVLDKLPSDAQTGDGREIRVRTIPLTQNGQIAVPQAQAIEPRAPAAVAPTAGIILRDSGLSGLPPSPPPAPLPAPPAVAAPPVQTRQVTITNTGSGQTATAPLAQGAQPTQAPAAPPKKVAAPPAEPKAPVQKKAREPDAYSPPQSAGAPAPAAPAQTALKTPAPPPAGKSAGFVAALSSHDTKDAALRSLADLQQTYGTALAGKLLDVAPTDAATKARGFNYRVVVGPPGSRQGAGAVCTQLKAAGYGTCWAVPFQTE